MDQTFRDRSYLKSSGLQILRSSMEIGLCWYKRGTNNKWTYNLTSHLMLDLETIIALASMTYIIDLDGYELHPRDENFFDNYINEC